MACGCWTMTRKQLLESILSDGAPVAKLTFRNSSFADSRVLFFGERAGECGRSCTECRPRRAADPRNGWRCRTLFSPAHRDRRWQARECRGREGAHRVRLRRVSPAGPGGLYQRRRPAQVHWTSGEGTQSSAGFRGSKVQLSGITTVDPAIEREGKHDLPLEKNPQP